MSRFDHVVPKNGSFRAHLASAIPENLVERLWGVGLDSQGRIVKGAGETGIVGVTVQTKAYPAGKRIDVMTSGQVVEFQPTAVEPGKGNVGDAGTVYYCDSDGNIVGASNEVQTITISGTDPFTLTVGSFGTTDPIDDEATVADVQSALDALAGINPGDITVSENTGAPDFTVTFGGQFSGENVPAMTATGATIGTATEGGDFTGLTRIGHTVEGQRLVVRVGRSE